MPVVDKSSKPDRGFFSATTAEGRCAWRWRGSEAESHEGLGAWTAALMRRYRTEGSFPAPRLIRSLIDGLRREKRPDQGFFSTTRAGGKCAWHWRDSEAENHEGPGGGLPRSVPSSRGDTKREDPNHRGWCPTGPLPSRRTHSAWRPADHANNEAASADRTRPGRLQAVLTWTTARKRMSQVPRGKMVSIPLRKSSKAER